MVKKISRLMRKFKNSVLVVYRDRNPHPFKDLSLVIENIKSILLHFQGKLSKYFLAK